MQQFKSIDDCNPLDFNTYTPKKTFYSGGAEKNSRKPWDWKREGKNACNLSARRRLQQYS